MLNTRPRRVAALAIVAIIGVGVGAYVMTRGDDTRGVAIDTCQDELVSMLRDPDSVQFEEVTAERGEEEPHGWAVTGNYRARNGFGGMNSDVFVCITDPDGNDPTLLTGEQLDE